MCVRTHRAVVRCRSRRGSAGIDVVARGVPSSGTDACLACEGIPFWCRHCRGRASPEPFTASRCAQAYLTCAEMSARCEQVTTSRLRQDYVSGAGPLRHPRPLRNGVRVRRGWESPAGRVAAPRERAYVPKPITNSGRDLMKLQRLHAIDRPPLRPFAFEQNDGIPERVIDPQTPRFTSQTVDIG